MNSVLCENCGNDNLPEARFCYYCGSQLMTLSIQPIEQPQVALENMGFGIRFLAAIIDGVIIIVFIFIFFRVSFFSLFNLVPGIFVAWLYFWLFTGLKSQTIGKMAVGIRVVKDDGTTPGPGYAALREIIGKSICTLGFLIGFIWIIFDDDKKGWHDYIAQTFVTRVKSGSG